MGIPAKAVYLFPQPLMRDAAYQLQVPSDRARLHRTALEIIEAMFGGPPPEPTRGRRGELKCEPHATDPVAADLTEHIRGIRAWEDDDDGSLLARELLYLRRAAEYAETQFDNADAVRHWQSLAELTENSAPATAAESLRRAGLVLGKSGRAPEAAPLLERARSMAAETGNRRAEGIATGNLAGAYRGTGRMEEAERTHEQALAIHREVGDRYTEGIALGNLAGVYQQTGRLNEAERTYQQALTIYRDVGERRAEGVALANLAVVYEQTGRMEEAKRTAEQALTIHRQVGDRRTEGIALGNLALVYQQTGRLKEAERTGEQALAIHRETGNRRSEGISLGNVADLYQRTGRMKEAERSLERALAIHREVGNRASEGIALGNLAGVYQQTGRVEEAKPRYLRALAISRETHNRRFEGLQSCDYALCLLVLKRADAGDTWRAGAAVLKAVGGTADLERKTTNMRKACAKAGVAAFDE